MSLETSYAGLALRSPFIVGASPLCDDVEMACRLQDAGAGAVVMRSLFEEQIDAEREALINDFLRTADGHSEALSYFPQFDDYQLAPDRYLRQLGELKSALTIPVIASLNGCHAGSWTTYAARMESAGADAIELNLYHLATDPLCNALEVEEAMIETVASVVQRVRIPVAVKLSPFHTSLVQFARALEHAGARGLVFFNRFYQPDFDLENLEVKPELHLSDSSELLLRLRWLAIVSPHVKMSLAASGGVHHAPDALKAIAAGASAVQLVSALLRDGPRHLTSLRDSVARWLAEHEYASLADLRGCLDLRRCPAPEAFERANYQRILQSWRL